MYPEGAASESKWWRNTAESRMCRRAEAFFMVCLEHNRTSPPAGGQSRKPSPHGPRAGSGMRPELVFLFFLKAKYFMLAEMFFPLLAAGSVFVEERLPGLAREHENRCLCVVFHLTV